MTDDIAAIAEGLTPRQREFLLWQIVPVRAVDLNHGWHIYMLIRNGLATIRRRWWLVGPELLVLTPLGLAVKSHLEQERR